MFYNNRKKRAIEKLKKAESHYKNIGKRANTKALKLYNLRKQASAEISNVESYLMALANSPAQHMQEIEQTKLIIKDFNRATEIEKEVQNNKIKEGGLAGGVFAGTAIATLGPTAAMTIATTFGTASTGTAIAALSGAAAQNAALAWLGGGALAAGGGGMAAGEAFLALAGPAGWALAGVLALGGGVLAIRNNLKVAEKAEECLVQMEPHIADLERKLQELNNLYKTTEKLLLAIDVDKVCSDFPTNYCEFSDDQKLKLGALINSTRTMAKLINRRII